MLSAVAAYGNVVMVCAVGPVILGPIESAMSWVYCYWSMMLNENYEAIMCLN